MSEVITPAAEWLTAQNGCIGCVLLDASLIGQLLAETSADDFSAPAKVIYQTISGEVSEGRSVDAIRINELLGGAYQDYLLGCLEVTPSAKDLDGYMAIVREKGKLARVQQELLRGAYAGTLDEVQSCLDSANEAMTDRRKASTFRMKDLMLDFYSRKQTAETYIPTGFPQLDAAMYLSAGDYVVLAGRPSRGKTALALQMALKQSRQYRVGFYSLETSSRKVADRLICHYSQLPMEKIKRADLDSKDWQVLGQATSALANSCKLDVVEAAGWSVDDVFRTAIANHHEVIYIDYLQIVKGDGKSRYDEVTGISVRIHQLAQRHGIMVVALSQLNRESVDGKSEEPDMSDLRESGQIEQDADAILMIYCQTAGRTDGPRWLKIAKNKEGELAMLAMAWDGSTQTLTPMSRRTPPAIPKTIRPLPDSTPVPEEFEQQEIR